MTINDENYIVIQGWMINDYGLTGDDLLTFAMIHGFSQGEFGWYIGGRSYIAEWLGCSDKKAGAILQRLTGSGYVKRVEMKGEKGWKTYRYRTLIGAKNAHINELNKGENVPPMRAKNAHINNNNIINNINIRDKDYGKPSMRCKCGGLIAKNTQNGIYECSSCGKKYPINQRQADIIARMEGI